MELLGRRRHIREKMLPKILSWLSCWSPSAGYRPWVLVKRWKNSQKKSFRWLMRQLTVTSVVSRLRMIGFMIMITWTESEKSIWFKIKIIVFVFRFLGMAHSKCNLDRREQYKLTCFAHNFSGYDSHFLVKHLQTTANPLITHVWAVPINTEKFKSIVVNR